MLVFANVSGISSWKANVEHYKWHIYKCAQAMYPFFLHSNVRKWSVISVNIWTFYDFILDAFGAAWTNFCSFVGQKGQERYILAFSPALFLLLFSESFFSLDLKHRVSCAKKHLMIDWVIVKKYVFQNSQAAQIQLHGITPILSNSTLSKSFDHMRQLSASDEAKAKKRNWRVTCIRQWSMI